MGSDYSVIPERLEGKANDLPVLEKAVSNLLTKARDSSFTEFIELVQDALMENKQALTLRSDFDHPYFLNHPRTILHLLAYKDDDSSCKYVNSNIRKLWYLCTKHLHRFNIDAGLTPELDDDERELNIDNKDPSALYVACATKNIDAVKALIACGADTELGMSCDRQSPLGYAVLSDKQDMVSLLLACGCSPHTRDGHNSYTPLKQATSAEVTKLLLLMNGDVNARSSVDWGLLNFTPVRGNMDIALTLLANGANPRARDSDTKKTPRFTAFLHNEVKDLYSRAEHYHARLCESLANPEMKHTSAKVQREVDSLSRVYAPYRLTPQVVAKEKGLLYLQSLRYMVDVKDIVCELCEAKIHAHVGTVILDFLFLFIPEPGMHKIFDPRTDVVVNYDEDYVDPWDEPLSDADTENNFCGEPFDDDNDDEDFYNPRKKHKPNNE